MTYLSTDVDVELRGRWLVAHLAQPCRALSWALVGGGFQTCQQVTWWQVMAGDLAPSVDAEALLRRQLGEASLSGAVAMMTSRRLDRFVHIEEHDGDLQVQVVATLGLSNGVAAGDAATFRETPSTVSGAASSERTASEVPGTSGEGASGEGMLGGKTCYPTPDTINILCHISQPLNDLALIESLALVAEARTAALLQEPWPSSVSGRPVTGTGTDCITVTCPVAGVPRAYAGKHGVVGATIGRAVRRATLRGREQWQQDRNSGDLAIPTQER